MADFVLVDKNKYKIVGTLTEEDITRINSFKNRTTLILDNTVGLSSELISKIDSERVVFSIKGGLDYETKEKYMTPNYIERTFVSPLGLKKIIRYFEYTESLVDPSWNEFEKAMFLYNALVVDMDYAERYDTVQPQGVTERSLNGILYGKLVCAGFALVYKEMLDRIGIKNYYQNQKSIHAFNIIEVDGKKYGVDVTWDNCYKQNTDGKCNFGRFAHDPDFYNRHGHQLYANVEQHIDDDNEDIGFRIETVTITDKDEESFDLSTLSMDEVNEYYSHIASRINSRKPFRYNLHDYPVDIKNKYLPIDVVNTRLTEEANRELPIIVMLSFLKYRNNLQIDQQLLSGFSTRKGYILDISSQDYSSLDLSTIGINNYSIDADGSITYKDEKQFRIDSKRRVGMFAPKVTQDEIDTVCKNLNEYLRQYFIDYAFGIVENINSLLEAYEYKPDEWDENRAVESTNIFTKLSLIMNCKDFLSQIGLSDEKINSLTSKIQNRIIEVHKPYIKPVTQKEMDLDFLHSVFADDLNMVWQTMEHDLQRSITEEEFMTKFCDVDYMMALFEKNIILFGEGTIKFSDYAVKKEELQQVLNTIMQDYQKKKANDKKNNFE